MDFIKKYFRFNELGTNYRTELFAGITTFLAMVYILGVNPSMLSVTGMSTTGVFFATAVASGVACIVMGLISKYPISLAPGMGLNALFTYTFVLGMGNTWETALSAVFVSSIFYLIITVSGLRDSLLDTIPHELKLAICTGIGFFVAFIGLSSGGIILFNADSGVMMGNLLLPSTFLALISIVLTFVFHFKKIPLAIFFSMIITSIIGICMVTFGITDATGLMPTVPHSVVSANFDLSVVGAFTRGFTGLLANPLNMVIMVFSALFVDLFDTTGSLLVLGRQCGLINNDGTGDVDGLNKAFISDGIGTLIGAILGTSTVTTYTESGTGIAVGGKTGIATIVTGLLFICSIFFAPFVLALFTTSVTCGALVMVGIQHLLVVNFNDIDWHNIVIVSSVFMTIIMIILTFSISLGIAWGFLTYVLGMIATKQFHKVSKGTIILSIIFIAYLFFGLI